MKARDAGGPLIDSHQHVWDPSRARYDWLGPESAPIDRAMGMDGVLPSFAMAGVDATVLVQSADNSDDTQLMLDTAREHPEVVAIVGYVPLERPDAAATALDELRTNPLIVGIRNLIHNQPDPDWLLRPEVDEGLGVLERAGVTFDLVAVLPRHLEILPLIGERHPQLNIVIDHSGKPPIGLTEWQPWWQLIQDAAANPRVYSKLSGLYSATPDLQAWTVEQIRPHFERVVSVFGAGRVMYGGDWPVSILAGGYDRVWDALLVLFDEFDEADRTRMLGLNAVEFYGIPQSRIDAALAHRGPRSAPISE